MSDEKINVHCFKCGKAIEQMEMWFIESTKLKCKSCKIEYYIDSVFAAED